MTRVNQIFIFICQLSSRRLEKVGWLTKEVLKSIICYGTDVSTQEYKYIHVIRTKYIILKELKSQIKTSLAQPQQISFNVNLWYKHVSIKKN